MGTSLQEIKEAAAALPMADRASLFHFIADSLDCEMDQDVLNEWLDVAERRMAEVEAGTAVGIHAEEFLKSLPGGDK